MRVAFIGSVGVPNVYGGFEMFLDSCTPYFAENCDEVYVTCDKKKYSDQTELWNGVRRIFIPVSANGWSSVFHDFYAFFSVFFKVDTICVLGVSAGIFFPLFHLLCFVFNKKLIVNVDGVEWRRNKFSKLKKAFLFVSDRSAQLFANCVVVDNEGLRPFLLKAIAQKAVFIAYPGDHVQRFENINKEMTEINLLTVCRIEPENNCELLLEAFKKYGKGNYIFVGNWDSSSYGRSLKAKYSTVTGLNMLNPVYDKDKLGHLRETCQIYLHGHEVGGTNPSLVEMLFYDCQIFAFDCVFNRNTARNQANYFSNVEQLVSQLNEIPDLIPDRKEIRATYTKESIGNSYLRIL